MNINEEVNSTDSEPDSWGSAPFIPASNRAGPRNHRRTERAAASCSQVADACARDKSNIITSSITLRIRTVSLEEDSRLFICIHTRQHYERL
jgi:hypothetical protein